VNHELINMAQQYGMRWDLSAAYTLEQNGVAESSNKVVVTRARSMLIDSGMPTML